MKKNKLILKNIKKSFQSGKSVNVVIDDVSTTFIQGESYAISGVSGVGKSTLLSLLAGFEQPTHGQVMYNDRDLETFDSGQQQQFLSRDIGVIFQQPYLVNELSVLQNCMLKSLIVNESHAQEQALELLDLVGLAEKHDAVPGTLSGGQQQRVAIARALMGNPSFLLADEPTGNLDAHTGKIVIDLLVKIASEKNRGLIICSHDPYVIGKMNNHYCLHQGKLRKMDDTTS